MRKILKIAQREYIETAKTKTFILTVVFAPIIIGGIIFFTKSVTSGKTGPRPPLKIAVAKLPKELAERVKTSFDKYNIINGASRNKNPISFLPFRLHH